MSTKEIAIDIVNSLSEERLKAFITLFGDENIQAIIESNQIAADTTRTRYSSFDDVEKVILENE